MLEVRNLGCVRGDHRLFAKLNFSLQAGELLYLKGLNGSGKTSLMRIIAGLTLPAEGEVLWQNQLLSGQTEEFNTDLTYLGHLGAIKGELTAYENLRISSQMCGYVIDDEPILAALAKLGLAGREELPTKVLSQGQKRRVALARLLIVSTKLWILDEPFTALDYSAVELLKSVIADHLGSGGMVILTTHQQVDIDAGKIQTIDLSA